MNPEEQSQYLACNACLEDTEHFINVWNQWECVICGDVLDEDTL